MSSADQRIRRAVAECGRIAAERNTAVRILGFEIVKSREVPMIEVSKRQREFKLTRDVFERRLRQRFYDPIFDKADRQISEIAGLAWTAYDEYHKSPRTRKAGPGFADPEFELPIEWLDTRDRIQ